MGAVSYSEVLCRKGPGGGCVYVESRLKGIFIGRLHSSIIYSMRTYFGAHKKATLHSLARDATFIVKLQRGSHSIVNKDKKTTTTVDPILQQQRDPTECLQENKSNCRLCFMRGHQAKKCPVTSLQVWLTLFQQRENHKRTIPFKKNWLPSRGRSLYHRDPINRSYRSSPSQQSTNSSIILVQYNRQCLHLADRSRKPRLLVYSGRPQEKNVYKPQRSLGSSRRTLALLRILLPSLALQVKIVLALTRE